MSNVEETTKISAPETTETIKVEAEASPEIKDVKASPFAGLTAAAPSASSNKDEEGEADDNDVFSFF